MGADPSADHPGSYGPSTEEAVRRFQQQRGLWVDGVCGPETWTALVEAGYRPGDRLLYYTVPPLRGDDVALLQRNLGSLGFDAGRVDGIFGERTQRALLDFQRNAGLTPDAVAGPATNAALRRLGSRADAPEHVAQVREREQLRSQPHTLAGRRVVLGEAGGLNALVASIRRTLSGRGAQVMAVTQADGSRLAAQANRAGAHVLVGVRVADHGHAVAYYGAHGYESPGGRQLATWLWTELSTVLGAGEGGPVAMALPVLRETRMPAVVCELGPPRRVVEQGAALGDAVGRALGGWAAGDANQTVEG